MVCQGQGPRATPSKRLSASECPMTSRDWQREGWRGWLGPWRSDAGDPAITCDAVQITTLGLSRGLPQQRDRWENMNEISDYSWWDEYKEICFCSVNFSGPSTRPHDTINSPLAAIQLGEIWGIFPRVCTTVRPCFHAFIRPCRMAGMLDQPVDLSSDSDSSGLRPIRRVLNPW